MAHTATWRNEAWAKDVPGPVMNETLDNIQSDDGRPPTLAEAVKEARYVLSVYAEGSTQAQEELAGEDGPEVQARAQEEVRLCKAFIKKYEKLAEVKPLKKTPLKRKTQATASCRR